MNIKNTILNFFICIIVLVIISILLTKRFIYFSPISSLLPKVEEYQDIYVKHIHGWLLPNRNSDKIILYCPSNDKNISYRQEKIKNFNNMGYNVLIFDYSGFGKSRGIPNEQQFYDDGSLLLSFLLKSYSPNQIIIYGESIGATVAIYIGRRYGISKVILESPIPKINTLLNINMKFVKNIFNEFDTASYLNGFKGNTLIIYSIEDNKIPKEYIENLSKLSTQSIPTNGNRKNLNIPWLEIKRFIENNY